MRTAALSVLMSVLCAMPCPPTHAQVASSARQSWAIALVNAKGTVRRRDVATRTLAVSVPANDPTKSPPTTFTFKVSDSASIKSGKTDLELRSLKVGDEITFVYDNIRMAIQKIRRAPDYKVLLREKFGAASASYDPPTGILMLSYDFTNPSQLKDFEFARGAVTAGNRTMRVLPVEKATHVVPFESGSVDGVFFRGAGGKVQGVQMLVDTSVGTSLRYENKWVKLFAQDRKVTEGEFLEDAWTHLKYEVTPTKMQVALGAKVLAGVREVPGPCGRFALHGGNAGLDLKTLAIQGVPDKQWLETFLELKEDPPPTKGSGTGSSVDQREPDAAWAVLFRSENPGVWNSDVNQLDGLAVPLALAPKNIQYLRMRAADGRTVIIPMTNSSLDKAGAVTEHFGWVGRKAAHGEGLHLGIYDVRTSPKEGDVVVYESGRAHLGWGFGHKFEKNYQCASWNSEPLQSQWLEISVKCGPLNQAEKAFLLEDTSSGKREWFLSDLQEINPVVGFGAFGKKGEVGSWGWKINTNGEFSPNGLCIHCKEGQETGASYDVPPQATKLVGKVAIADAVKADGAKSPVWFKVVDEQGKVLWKSPRGMQRAGDVLPFEVMVVGVSQIRLITSCEGSQHNAVAVWIEPRLVVDE